MALQPPFIPSPIVNGASSNWLPFPIPKNLPVVTVAQTPQEGDFGPFTPGTTTAGLQEAVNYLFNKNYGKGVIFIKRGTYNVVNTVNLPIIYGSPSNGCYIRTPSGDTISVDCDEYVSLTFIGEGPDATRLIMGSSGGGGGFGWTGGGLQGPYHTRHAFANMTWVVNPNYPINTSSAINFYSGVVDDFEFFNMKLTGQPGQNVNFSVFLQGIAPATSAKAIVEHLTVRGIPAININPAGTFYIYMHDLDLYNSGYHDNTIAINISGSSPNSFVDIDGVFLGQNLQPPSNVTLGGSGQLDLSSNGYYFVPARLRNIYVTPSYSPGPLYIAPWQGLDAEITAINTAPTASFNQLSWSRLKVVQYLTNSSLTSTPGMQLTGTNTDVDVEYTVYNFTGNNLGNFLLAANNATFNRVRLRLFIYGNAVGTSVVIAPFGTNTINDFELIEADLTDQLNNAPGTTISYIPFTYINFHNVKPLPQFLNNVYGVSYPFDSLSGVTGASSFSAGTVYQNKRPYPVWVYVPVTLSATSSASATASLLVGPSSSSLTTVDSDTEPAGLTAGEVHTLKARVPPGYYFEVTATNATVGTPVFVIDV